ncbi:MAG: hypothetical protein ACLSVO_02970 [Alistipes sp.]|jgi:hypothetical protein|uniref:hypothetical protein n=1 Tax=Alistipes sp. TaxID=1872444 RepID=UPI003995CAB2
MNETMNLYESIGEIFRPMGASAGVAECDREENVKFQEVVQRMWVTSDLYRQIAGYIRDYAKVEAETPAYYRARCAMEEITFCNAATSDAVLVVSGDAWLHYVKVQEEWGPEEVLSRVDLDLTVTAYNSLNEKIPCDFDAKELKKIILS